MDSLIVSLLFFEIKLRVWENNFHLGKKLVQIGAVSGKRMYSIRYTISNPSEMNYYVHRLRN